MISYEEANFAGGSLCAPKRFNRWAEQPFQDRAEDPRVQLGSLAENVQCERWDLRSCIILDIRQFLISCGLQMYQVQYLG